MVALYTQLEQSGVTLSKKIGFIRWERTGEEVWHVTKAAEARVLTAAPTDPDTGEPALSYDPEHMLLFTIPADNPGEVTLFILDIDETVVFYECPGVGMVFRTEDQSLKFSQHPDFWDDVYGYIAALGQPQPKRGTHV